MIFTDEVVKTHCCSHNHLLLGHWITWQLQKSSPLHLPYSKGTLNNIVNTWVKIVECFLFTTRSSTPSPIRNMVPLSQVPCQISKHSWITRFCWEVAEQRRASGHCLGGGGLLGGGRATLTLLLLLVGAGLLVSGRAASRLLLLLVGGSRATSRLLLLLLDDRAAGSTGRRLSGVEAAAMRVMLRQLADEWRRARPAARWLVDLSVGEVPSHSRGVSLEWVDGIAWRVDRWSLWMRGGSFVINMRKSKGRLNSQTSELVWNTFSSVSCSQFYSSNWSTMIHYGNISLFHHLELLQLIHTWNRNDSTWQMDPKPLKKWVLKISLLKW
jgi:hypothetical protein